MSTQVSELFDARRWAPVDGFDGLEDITYHHDRSGRIARVAFDRPEVRNAFRPHTVDELYRALDIARQDPRIGAVLLTGNGPSPKDGGWAFCSGGDQRIRGRDGYKYSDDESVVHDPARAGRLHILEVQRLIRFMPKVVIAVVPGWAAGGGHSLHVVCDLTIAADNARFGQVGPKVGSFDGGFGASSLAQLVGMKKAKEIWFLCRQYDAQQALDVGLVNAVVPVADLERETVAWCREMLALSPFALRLLKASFHAAEDGYAGIQQLAHDANLLFYGSEEAQEGREAFKAKRRPDFGRFPRRP